MWLLQLTSGLFGSVVLHAYHLRCTHYHHLFLLVTVLSLLFHCHPQPPPSVRLADTAAAHFAFAFVVFTDGARASLELLCFPAAVLGLWCAQSFCSDPRHTYGLHVCLHGAALLGLHVFLWRLYA